MAAKTTDADRSNQMIWIGHGRQQRQESTVQESGVAAADVPPKMTLSSR
jgi:hypothetical protein